MAESSQQTRRRLIKAFGAATTASIAGCSGGNDEGDGGTDGNGGTGTDESSDSGESSGELGERVPTVTVSFWPNFPGITSLHENSLPSITKAMEELGIATETKGVNYTANLANADQDKRTSHFNLITYTTTPSRLDPQYMLESYVADKAGAFSGGNPAQYINCEYTDLAYESGVTPDREQRQQVINDAYKAYSQDVPTIPLTDKPAPGLVRQDKLNLGKLGDGGFTVANPLPYIYSTPKDGNSFASSRQAALFETRNFPVIANGFSSVIWNHLLSTTLVEYDENFQLQNMLAKSIEYENDGKRVVVELEDATFHNGDPITAEDVKWTYDFRWNNVGVFPQTEAVPRKGDSGINIVDDKTVEFNFTKPFAALTTRIWPALSVLHKQSWQDAGAEDNPQGVEPKPFVGSGPFKLKSFQKGRSMVLEPHGGHPIHEPDHEVVMRAYKDVQTSYRAFKNNEVQVLPSVTPATIQRANQEMGDQAKGTVAAGTMPFNLIPENNWGPTKFRPVRLAIGAAIDRQTIVDQAYRGQAKPELHCRNLLDAHPFGVPTDELLQFTDDPTGNVEQARQILEDAGFGWDDNGNLHYPPDADLQPKWPKGEKPPVGDFPCLDKEGYVDPENR
jgi:peptide/nickel transport system substrate-binding protein